MLHASGMSSDGNSLSPAMSGEDELADVQVGRSLLHGSLSQSGRSVNRLEVGKIETGAMNSMSRTVSRSTFASSRSCHHSTSLKNSPSFLAQRVLRKYHRPHVSKAVERKLYLDNNYRVKTLRRWSALRERNRKIIYDPQMPKLCDVSVVVEKLELQQHNGKVQSEESQNDPRRFQLRAADRKSELISPCMSEAGDNAEVQNISLHLSDSEDEDNMPRLRRVSTEEKAVETTEKSNDIWHSNIPPISASVVLSKLKNTFGCRKEKHHKFNKDLKSESPIPKNEHNENGLRTVGDHVQLDSGHSSSARNHQKNGLTSRRNVFSVFEKALQSTELNTCDRPESMPDLTEPGEKNSIGSINSYGSLEMPELDEETNPAKDEIAHSMRAGGSMAGQVSSDISELEPEFTKRFTPNLVDNPTRKKDEAVKSAALQLAKSVSDCASDSTWNTGKRKKRAVSDCGIKADLNEPEIERNVSRLLPVHPADAAANDSLGFMTDLAGLKQDREDQTEFYTESLSSLDEELVIQPKQLPGKSNAKYGNSKTSHRAVPVRHRREPGAPDDEEWTPQKYRRRHKTVDGSPSPVAESSQPLKVRERRQRPRSLSHGCTCCMDHGSGRKRRKRRQSLVNGMQARHTAWMIPEELSLAQQNYVRNCTRLIALRHKVYKLCQVLFPKLQHTWLINPDTENVDLLVAQITGVVNTLEDKTGGDSRSRSEHCKSKGTLEYKTESFSRLTVIETLEDSKTGESSEAGCPSNHLPLACASHQVNTVINDGMNVDCGSVSPSCPIPSSTSESSSNRFGDKLLNSGASSQNEEKYTVNTGDDSDSCEDNMLYLNEEESNDLVLHKDVRTSQLGKQTVDCDLAEAVEHSDPMLPNLNCCLNSEPDMEIDPPCTIGTEEVMPLLECYKSDLGKSELSGVSSCSSEKHAFDSKDQWLVLDSIDEESVSLPGLFDDEGELAPIAPSLIPFSEPSSAATLAWPSSPGNTKEADVTLPDYLEAPPSSTESTGKEPKAWESEFMKYLSGRGAFDSSAGDSADGCAKSIDGGSASPSLIVIAGEDSGVDSSPSDGMVRNKADYNLLDIKVALCNDPHSCLTQLRKKVMYLLKPLLPNLTFENNFDKFSDDVDMLVDLVRQSNETKEMRLTSSPVISRT